MSLRPNERTEARRKRYKVVVYPDKGRWRREDNLVKIRKNERGESLLKKRGEVLKPQQPVGSLLQNKVGRATMKIPSLLYLCFWALVSVLALTSVRVLLNKVDQFSNHYSVLETILHTFLCFSLSRVFLFNPFLSKPGRDSGSAPPVYCYIYLHVMLSFSFHYTVIVEDSSITPLLVVVPSVFVISATYLQPVSKTMSMDFFHWHVWVIFMAFASIIYQDIDHTIKIQFFNAFSPYVIGPTIAYVLFLYKIKLQSVISIKVPITTKIIVGLIGNILASHYLKDKSFLLFWLVVSLAIFWLGNIAMMQSSCQPGIFEFLVGAILDIAGDLFGLNKYMWLVGFGCAVLFIFFENLDKINMQYPSRGRERGWFFTFSLNMFCSILLPVMVLIINGNRRAESRTERGGKCLN